MGDCAGAVVCAPLFTGAAVVVFGAALALSAVWAGVAGVLAVSAYAAPTDSARLPISVQRATRPGVDLESRIELISHPFLPGQSWPESRPVPPNLRQPEPTRPAWC